jgi:hypothetical protein
LIQWFAAINSSAIGRLATWEIPLSLTRISATLKPMKMFRLILTLLLCLTVPVAGWASTLSGSMCPQLQHALGAQDTAAHHSERTHPEASVASLAGHKHTHCGGVSTNGQPCKGDHCACGCGMGSCASLQLLPLTLHPSDFMLGAGRDLLPHGIESAFLVARGTSPLRPPIL